MLNMYELGTNDVEDPFLLHGVPTLPELPSKALEIRIVRPHEADATDVSARTGFDVALIAAPDSRRASSVGQIVLPAIVDRNDEGGGQGVERRRGGLYGSRTNRYPRTEAPRPVRHGGGRGGDGPPPIDPPRHAASSPDDDPEDHGQSDDIVPATPKDVDIPPNAEVHTDSDDAALAAMRQRDIVADHILFGPLKIQGKEVGQDVGTHRDPQTGEFHATLTRDDFVPPQTTPAPPLIYHEIVQGPTPEVAASAEPQTSAVEQSEPAQPAEQAPDAAIPPAAIAGQPDHAPLPADMPADDVREPATPADEPAPAAPDIAPTPPDIAAEPAQPAETSEPTPAGQPANLSLPVAEIHTEIGSDPLSEQKVYAAQLADRWRGVVAARQAGQAAAQAEAGITADEPAPPEASVTLELTLTSSQLTLEQIEDIAFWEAKIAGFEDRIAKAAKIGESTGPKDPQFVENLRYTLLVAREEIERIKKGTAHKGIPADYEADQLADLLDRMRDGKWAEPGSADLNESIDDSPSPEDA